MLATLPNIPADLWGTGQFSEAWFLAPAPNSVTVGGQLILPPKVEEDEVS